MLTKPTALKIIFVLSLVLALIFLLPFVVLCFYNVPVADDLMYANVSREHGLFHSQLWWYQHWTGRYTASFFITLNRLSIWWTPANSVFPCLALTGFCLTLYYFFKQAFRLASQATITITTLFVGMYLANMHTISQAIYWVPSLYTYLAGLVFLLFFWGYYFRFFTKTQAVNTKAYLVSGLLLFLMMGTSELMIFYQNYLLLGILVYCCFHRKAFVKPTLYLVGLSILFGLVSLLAPGNFTRRQFNATRLQTDYLRQTTVMLDSLRKWLLPRYLVDVSFWLLLLFTLAFFGAYVYRNDNQRTLNSTSAQQPRPLVLATFLFGGFLVTLLPQIIANTSEERAFNFSLFAFLLAAVISVGYGCWFYRQHRFANGWFQKPVIALLVFLFCGATFLLPSKKIFRAYSDIFSGDAACYRQEQMHRLHSLQSQQGQQKAILPRLACKPASLFVTDAAYDPDSWKNDGYRYYFSIDTVRLVTPL